MTTSKIGGSFEATRELRWRIAKDGLYQSIDGGAFRRIASGNQFAHALYAVGMVTIGVSDENSAVLQSAAPRRLSWNGTQLMTNCIELLQTKLCDRTVIIDVERHGPFNHVSRFQAGGFKLSVRGLGPIFAVKRHILRHIIPGSMPLNRLLNETDRRGWLLRGADGMSTRQVVIPGYGRDRFYCFKLAAAGDRLWDQNGDEPPPDDIDEYSRRG